MGTLILILFYTNCLISCTSALTCNDILDAPEDTKWTITELSVIPPTEIVACLNHLGKHRISLPEASFIWKTVVSFFNGVGNVPQNVLERLNWVTIAISPDDFYNMTINSVELIEHFGMDYNLNYEQLAAIADRVRDEWGGKEPEDYSFYDLVALRQILCAFNRSEIERIHPEAYREAAAVLGKLNNCDPEVLEGFAVLAMRLNAFGPPSQWDDADTKAIGFVADHLPKNKRKIPDE